MKKVIGMFAVLAFAGNLASAELLKNVKYNGSLDVKNVIGQKSVVAAKSDFSNTTTRAMLGVNFDLNEDINAQVTAVKTDYRKYGSDNGQTIDNITANVTFAEAYVGLKNVLYLNHKFGRQFYGNAGDIVIYYGPTFAGNNNVANYSVSALDGWYGDWAKGKWAVTGLMAKVNELSANTPKDVNLYGVTGKYDYSEMVKASAYVYQKDDRNDATFRHNTLDVFGVKAEGKVEGIGYGAEYAMNAGKDKQHAGTVADPVMKYQGTALKVNADYNLDAKELGKFALMGEFSSGSGNKATPSATKNEEFQAINHNYLPGMIFGTYGVGQTMNGIGNLTTMNVGAKYMPKQIEKLSVGAKFFTFAPTEDITVGGVKVNKYGSELDLCANWKHSENVGLKASYAMFMPEKKFAGKDTTETLMGIDLNLKF